MYLRPQSRTGSLENRETADKQLKECLDKRSFGIYNGRLRVHRGDYDEVSHKVLNI